MEYKSVMTVKILLNLRVYVYAYSAKKNYVLKNAIRIKIILNNVEIYPNMHLTHIASKVYT